MLLPRAARILRCKTGTVSSFCPLPGSCMNRQGDFLRQLVYSPERLTDSSIRPLCTDISIYVFLFHLSGQKLIYHNSTNANIFCDIDISVDFRSSPPLRRVSCRKKLDLPMPKNRNVYKIIAKSGVPPGIVPGFLCKTAKYTSCTVFPRKFIHFGNSVNLRAKIRAIFVRFILVSLQNSSFFFLHLLLSYLYTTECSAEPPFFEMFSIRRRTK